MTSQGTRLKTIRNELKLSQDEMGKIFCATKSYISQIENDKCNFSVAQLITLLHDYNVNLNYLLGGIGTPFIQKENKNIQEDILKEIKEILDKKGIK